MDHFRFIEHSSYSTPETQSRKCLAATLFGAGLPFYLLTMKVLYKYSRIAQKGLLDQDGWMHSSLEWANAVETCGGSLAITGRDHLQNLKGPAVFVGNHMSTAETFLLPGIILPTTPLTFVIKESLTTLPFFAPIMNAAKPIIVSRENSRADLKVVMSQGIENLKQGTSVCIFPQSTRSPIFDSAKFNSLGAKLAARAEVPVIPFAVKTDFWSNGKWIKELGWVYPDRTMKLAFGAPIAKELDAKLTQDQIVNHVRSNLTTWGVQCL